MYFIDWRAGVVVAAALSLLVAPGSAVMTASGAAGSDGVLPWRQPFLSVIECMCDLLMYWMYILSYIESEMT